MSPIPEKRADVREGDTIAIGEALYGGNEGEGNIGTTLIITRLNNTKRGRQERYKCRAILFVRGNDGLALIPSYTYEGNLFSAWEDLHAKLDRILLSLMNKNG